MDVFSNLVNDTIPDPKVGDTVEWGGRFVSGYLTGKNKIARIYQESGYYWMELDNKKCFIIKPINKKSKHIFKKIHIGWKLVNTI